ncbi:hypothetical protein B296_00015326 [Ensete ventricosum]|uniref:Uncharacterized protein n=1 Tax=Ensete ventricosum TaxID=4639 RepID=A0A427A9H5_ENSVE|nr:hypothetical protein B296_00015326 [Ensete ventricosum]
MIQEGCVFEWHNIIAAAAREGFAGEDELQWSSYKILSEQLQQEWLESIEKRKTMPRLLIAEAEKAVQALELAALTNPVAQASLLETRKLIAEATWSIKNIERGQLTSQGTRDQTFSDSVRPINHLKNSPGNLSEWELVRMSGDSELDLGGRLLEWWNPGEEGVLQFGSAADSCEKVGCTSTGAPHTSVRPVACVESATSAGQLSEGVITWRPGQHLSYHSSPREGLLEAHDEGAEDERELGKCDVARVDPTERELGKCDVARVDPTKRELGKYDVVRVDPTEQELRNAM